MSRIYSRALTRLVSITLLSISGFAQEQESIPAAATRGEQIYNYGAGPSGIPVEAVVGDGNASVPAAVLRCVNCHGPDGRGKPEGGIYPPNIRWSELSKPYAITTNFGRERPSYTESLAIRAITMGIDSGGTHLNAAMPRYQLTLQQADDLVAYLKALDHISDPGVTGQSIKLGVFLPPEKTFEGMNRALRETLTAVFARVNDEGGIYGRKIVCEFSTAPESMRAEALRSFIEREKPFALVESFIAGDESEIASIVQENEIPMIGAISLFSGIETPANRYIFFLLSGVQAQGESLMKFAAIQQRVGAARFIIIYGDETGIQAAIDQISEWAKTLGWVAPRKVNVNEVSDWSLLLREQKVDVVLWLAAGEDLGRFFSAAAQDGVYPTLLAPSAFVGPEIYDAPKQFSGKVFLAFPILPTDQTREGETEFLELARTGRFSQGNLAERLTALSAADLLIYGLQKAGKEVTREKIIEILEQLYRFDTGHTAPLTFTKNRRVGAKGAHVIGIDLERKQPLPPSVWVELESP
jgi:ABC-type branched-subunit amino acid transport system substrate-binding protein